jgi:alpha-D-xyloside xylohydrolase
MLASDGAPEMKRPNPIVRMWLMPGKRFTISISVLFLLLASASIGRTQWIAPNPVTGVEKRADGVVLTMQSGTLWIQVCTDSIVRIRYSPTATFPDGPDYVVTRTNWSEVPWNMQSTDKDVTLSTSRMKVTVSRNNGAIEYSDSSGAKMVQEATRTLTPAKVNGEDTYRAESFFSIYGSEEAFYGLGQHQAGVWNYRGESVDISQENTQIAVPLLLSSKGYGIFWNNTSRSRFNNRFVHSLYVSSEVADTIDYYFFYGPEFDDIIADYRMLTGAAPMFGKWAYGFWQCKNKYQTQEEILGVAHKYRELHIPVDNIVQDWFWWTTTGEFKFNKNYPNPEGMVEDLHHNNFHLMISIWPYFYPGSETYADMDKRGFFIDKTKTVSFHPLGNALYDATNPAAAAYYWNLVNQSLLKIGVDAWWMDTDEPETEGKEENILLGHKLAIGSGDRYANIFPLIDTGTVYHGQRKETDRKRVFILSRSAFAGNQRNAVTAWSGDVLSDFESYKRQVSAGLNFALSGIPYWTTDIGGFFIGNPDDPAYRELFVRWFQFGAFCPIFRVHGTRTTNQNELWSYGPQAQKILSSFDRLRYRLLPYIYSLAWKTTSDSYTVMRPLAMDFRLDKRAQNVGDQFMFGPALLVNPVTEPAATERHLYLPKTKWYDFWTGSETEGGKAVDSPAPLERIPLFVRAGSIVPMGPDLQYSAEKPADPIELRVYRGADGDFTIYEDENDNYDYEKGDYATIAIHWDDAQHALALGERQGKFPGMLEKRTFRIVLVGLNHGTGIEPAAKADKVVEYSGKQIRLAL